MTLVWRRGSELSVCTEDCGVEPRCMKQIVFSILTDPFREDHRYKWII